MTELNVKLTEGFEEQFEAAAKHMQEHKLDSYVIPESTFRMLRRSCEEAKNLDTELDLIIPMEMNGELWILTL